jgi:hypothetical protein
MKPSADGSLINIKDRGDIVKQMPFGCGKNRHNSFGFPKIASVLRTAEHFFQPPAGRIFQNYPDIFRNKVFLRRPDRFRAGLSGKRYDPCAFHNFSPSEKFFNFQYTAFRTAGQRKIFTDGGLKAARKTFLFLLKYRNITY